MRAHKWHRRRTPDNFFGKYGEFRALVVQCNDICDNVREVETIDSVVSEMGADVLWLTSDSVGAKCCRSFYADYAGFCSGLKSRDLMRRAGYVADAVSQWWTGVAAGNRGTIIDVLGDKKIKILRNGAISLEQLTEKGYVSAEK